MRAFLIGVILLSVALLLVALLRFGFDVSVPGLEQIERVVREAPVFAEPPTAALPPSPGADPRRPAAVHPLPRLVAIVERQGVREALMMGPDHTPRRYRVGDRLPGTDAEILAIEEDGIVVRRLAGEERVAVTTPQQPADAEDPSADIEPDVYERCESLEGNEADECYADIDRRMEQLHDACDRLEEGDEDGGDVGRWEACTEAADRLEPYPG